MSGWLSNGLPLLTSVTGNEQFTVDTETAAGAQPETGAVSLQQLAAMVLFFSNNSSKTTVAGTIYYGSFTIGPPAGGVVTQVAAKTITGLSVLVGSTGGTDLWCVGLYNSAGVLVANSALAGATAGTAGTWQQFAFTTAYQAAPGTYYLALQSNGTTAHPAVYNGPALASIISGSQTGAFGTLAAISSLSTTYTAALAPVCLPYT